ncbi:MAG: arginase family protein, partial [Pseudomonadota bacterium]
MAERGDAILIGAPVQSGASQPGCLMGPDAFRTAGIVEELESLGFRVSDRGNLDVAIRPETDHPNPALRNLSATIGWTEALADAAYSASGPGQTPIFMG